MNKIYFSFVLMLSLSSCSKHSGIDCSVYSQKIDNSISSLDNAAIELNNNVKDLKWLKDKDGIISANNNVMSVAKEHKAVFDKSEKSSQEACDDVSLKLTNLYKSLTQLISLQNLIIQDVASSEKNICKNNVGSAECDNLLNTQYEKDFKAKSTKIRKEIISNKSLLN